MLEVSSGVIVVAAFLIAIAAWSVVSNRRMDARLTRLASQRAGIAEQDFVRYFEAQRIPAHVSDAVRRSVRDWIGKRTFPVLPQDDLLRVYELDDEETGDIILALLRESGRTSIPSRREMKESSPIGTVEDLVGFVWRFGKWRG
jgi:hypothetical protein